MNSWKLISLFLVFGISTVLAQGPAVDTFTIVDTGPTWIYLEWTMVVVDPNLIRYRLITDPGSAFESTSDVNCATTVCNYNVTYLLPCSPHEFEVTPYYIDGSTLVPGPSTTTSGSTSDIVPQSPTNGEITRNGEDVTISWDAPSDDTCVDSYEVCYTSEDESMCRNSSSTSIDVTDFYYCTKYDVQISSVSPSGLKSDALEVTTDAVNGVPGEVSNYIMLEITEISAHLTWDEPLVNGSCAHDYTVNWTPINDLGRINNLAGNLGNIQKYSHEAAEVALEDPSEFEAILRPLIPCVNYSFTVWAMSPEKEFGPPLTLYDPSDEVAPAQPSDLNIVTMGTTSIYVEWTISDLTCIDHFMLCWRHETNFIRICMSIYDTKHTITELMPCTGYDITVEAVSPNDEDSAPLRGAGYTNDEVPGAVQDLTVTEEMATNVTICWNKPLLHPQCVAEYTINVVDLNETSVFSIKKGSFSDSLEAENGMEIPSPFANSDYDFCNLIEGLEPCTYYDVSVYPVSPQGLEGPTELTNAHTEVAKPGAVQGLESYATSETSIEVHWIQPELNPRCAQCYDIIYTNAQTGAPGSGSTCRKQADQFDFTYALENLDECTHYTIQVVPVTIEDTYGLVASTDATTTCMQ